MKFSTHNQKGQALVLIVIAIVGLIGLVALAIDGGNAFSDRRHAQSAADTAGLAAALAKVHSQSWMDAGLSRAASNGYTNDGVRSTVQVTTDPMGPGCDGTVPNPVNPNISGDKSSYYILVVIHSNVDTYFASVLGVNQIHNCVQAIVRGRPSITVPIAYGNALVSLDPSSCKSFWVHGTSDSIVEGSGVFVNSSCNSDALNAFDLTGSGQLQAPNICVVGGATYNSGGVYPAPNTNCGPALPYPPDYIWPQPTCSVAATKGNNIVSPGNIQGSWISGNITMQPGIYCISGNVMIGSNDHITGNGVLWYFMDGGLTVNGGANVNISAPTGGDFAGLLIYLPLTNSNTIILNGDANSQYTGTILAPASQIQINGTNSNYGYHCQIIGFQIDLSGTGYDLIDYQDNQNFDITVPPSIDLVR